MSLRAKSGMVLFETLAYSAILAILINVLISIIISSGRLNAKAVSTLDRMNMSGDLREQFSKDAREAQRVSDSAASYKTGEEQLVLELPAQPEIRRYVVYGRLKSPKQVDRLEFTEKDGLYSPVRYQTFPMLVEGFRVMHDLSSPRQVAVEVDADQVGNRPVPKGATRKPPVVYRFAASLRSMGGAA